MSMMPIFQPQPCDNGCCANIFSGFCLQNGDPIAVVINNGLAIGWIDLLTGAFHVGPIPPGAGPCPIPVEITTTNLDCATDSITVCQGTDPWIISATNFDIRPLDCTIDSIEVCQGTSPWVVSGTVELGATTLAALEIITVVQGTSPWVVSGTDLDIRNLTCAQDSIAVCPVTVSATTSSVSQNAASVTLLAANASRKGAIIYNNSSSTMWIKFGATASQTSFSVRIVSETFYELSFGYTGIIDGIWIGAGAGAARLTEFT